MIQVYKEAFKARVTSLRARRVAECFQRRKCFNSILKNEFYKGVIWRTSPRCRKRPVGEFSMGRVRQYPYKTSFVCYFLEFAPLF
jgi:hypothetical protein